MNAVRIAVAVCAAATAILTGASALGARINTTPSMPVGLWLVTGKSASRGAIVLVCLTGPAAIEGKARGYIGLGSCPDHTEPLIKPVAAVAGDVVTVTRDGIAVNGRAVPHTAPRARDRAARPLQAVPAGTYRVAPGEVWLASGHDPRSFDSRYFGPVPVAAIRATVTPLMVF